MAFFSNASIDRRLRFAIRLHMRCSVFLAALVAALAGCGTTYVDTFTCADPDIPHLDANGEHDPCHQRDGDAGGAGSVSTCPGKCVPLSPPGWSEPVLLWSGPEAGPPPACPSWAPQSYPAGHADLTVPPLSCGSCSCDPPAGTCELPATILARSQPLCMGVPTPFNPPTEWAGECTSVNAIPSGELCGGALCAQSLAMAPLTLSEGGCAPIVVNPPVWPPGPPVWSTVAGTCVGGIVGTCSSPSEICAPVVPPPPPGFAVCIVTGGDRMCPDELSDKHVFYDHFEDSRACSACACSTPTGGKCTGVVSTFKDGDCNAQINSVTITSTAPSFCFSLPPGTALGSKSAGPLTHTPGTCQASGGDVVGSVDPVEAST